ncbi:MAG TPA: hypothetical protein VGJ57_09550 [Nitrospirales bacterium]|jgi:hypothetical protein
MKTSVTALIAALGFAAGSVVMAFAAEQAPLAEPSISSGQAQGFRIVQGEVLKMEGNTYLVRDETGQEVRLTVNKDSKVTTAFEVGDRIVAQVSDQGVVTLINKSEAGPETGTTPSAPGQKR